MFFSGTESKVCSGVSLKLDYRWFITFLSTKVDRVHQTFIFNSTLTKTKVEDINSEVK